MIFQSHNLLRCLTAEQNVQMGADLIVGLTYLQKIARKWLSAVGLEEHHKKLPSDLSGVKQGSQLQEHYLQILNFY